MTSLAERSQIIILVQEAMNSGARQDRACTAINFNARTLQRWQIDQSLGDQRPCRTQTPTNKLSVRERKHVLAVANSDCRRPYFFLLIQEVIIKPIREMTVIWRSNFIFDFLGVKSLNYVEDYKIELKIAK